MKKVTRWSIIIAAFLFALALRTIAHQAIEPSALSRGVIGLFFFGFILGVWKLTESLEDPRK